MKLLYTVKGDDLLYVNRDMLKWKGFESPVAIVGAGFSYACTNGRLPLMKGFFDKLTADEFPELNRFVRFVNPDLSDANVEAVHVLLDQIETTPSKIFRHFPGDLKGGALKAKEQLLHYAFQRLVM